MSRVTDFRKGTSTLMLLLVSAMALMFLFPFLWMLATSFKPEADIMGHPEWFFPRRFTFVQYLKLWTAIPFPRFFINSVIFAGGVTTISLAFDCMAAYAFAKLHFRGIEILFFLVLGTMMVPFQVTMVPLYLLLFNLGGLDTYWGLIVPRMTNAFGIFMLRQFFITLPDSLLDAARMDGVSEYGIFRRIALPLTKMTIVTLAIFHFMYNWDDFLWPLIITSSVGMRTLPVGLALFVGEHVQEHGPVIAGSVLSIIPILVFYLLAQKSFIQGIALSGLKG
jgi:multiple sugar transport system permease protein